MARDKVYKFIKKTTDILTTHLQCNSFYTISAQVYVFHFFREILEAWKRAGEKPKWERERETTVCCKNERRWRRNKFNFNFSEDIIIQSSCIHSMEASVYWKDNGFWEVLMVTKLSMSVFLRFKNHATKKEVIEKTTPPGDIETKQRHLQSSLKSKRCLVFVFQNYDKSYFENKFVNRIFQI